MGRAAEKIQRLVSNLSEKRPVFQALNRCWETLAECFEPEELLMKQDLIDKYFAGENH